MNLQNFSPSPDSIESAEVATTPKTSPSPKNKVLATMATIFFLIVIGSSAYYFGTKKSGNSLISNNMSDLEQPDTTPLPSTPQKLTPLFSGQIKRIDENLQIFKLTSNDLLNDVSNNFIYYFAGKFLQGEFKDYDRVIAIRPPEGPSEPKIFTLATKDYQSYVLNDPENATVELTEDDWNNPYYFLDKSKIISIAVFENEHPQVLELDDNFNLFLERFSTKTIATDNKDQFGNIIYDNILDLDFSASEKLSSPQDHLSLYLKTYKQDETYFDQLSKEDQNRFQLRKDYVLGYTEVIVVDSVGLPVSYAMTYPENVEIYESKSQRFKEELKNYNQQMEKYENKEITQFPQYPEHVYLPSLGFLKSQISSQNNSNFFNNYQTAFPEACAFSQNSKIINVFDQDLEQIGTVFGQNIYALKDKNHPLYKLAYDIKMEFYNYDPNTWASIYGDTPKPSLEQYVAQNPLLFIKNFWGQWVALGEFDIQVADGCGKPVVYLYPTQPTEIKIKFDLPIQFSTDIPKYKDFWHVKAYPDGSLVNLKPEQTNCHELDFVKRGSEYAQKSCQTNTYPYLFWAGSVVGRNYPEISGGWIVKRQELKSFLNKKLTEMGLSDTEKNDFTSYWLPEMLEKNVPFYRVSFLQTSELNSLFPMIIEPKPDTIYRIFLDYEELMGMPELLPKPQILNKLVRNGFTLVEWGGLKR